MKPSNVDEIILNILNQRGSIALTKTLTALVLEKSKYNKVFVPVANYLKKQNAVDSVDGREIDRLVKIGRENLIKQKRTLGSIKKVLNKEGLEFLISRTKRTIPYVTFDIDIIVKNRDFDNTVKAFRNAGYEIKKHGRINGIKKEYQMTAKKDEELLIDIHKNVSWLGSTYISEDEIWDNHKMGKILGIQVPIPSDAVELVLVSANILFEKFHLTLLDYLYLQKLARGTDLKSARKIAKSNKWLRNLTSLIQTVKSSGSTGSSDTLFKNNHNLSFPLVMSDVGIARILLNRSLVKREVSLISILYTIYLVFKMKLKKDFYPYYFPY